MSDISDYFDGYLIGFDLGQIFREAETTNNLACMAIINAAFELMVEDQSFGRKIYDEYYRILEGEAGNE